MSAHRADEANAVLTERNKCVRDIETKLETINRGWRELANRTDLTGAERYVKKQAIFRDSDDFKELVRKLDEINGKPE